MGDETDKWEAKKRDIRGIKIRNFNFIMIVITCFIYGLLIFLTMKGYESYTNLEKSTQRYISCQQIAEQLRNGSDYLTEQIRFYAETGNPEYVQAYFKEANETRRRDRAVEQLRQMGVDDSLEVELTEAMHWSKDLMNIECYSMRLTAEAYGTDINELPGEVQRITLSKKDAAMSAAEKEKKGRNLVFNVTYKEYKDNIYIHLDNLVQQILLQTQGRITDNTLVLSQILARQRVMITILFILNLIMFGCIIVLVVRPLQIYIGNIKEDTLFDIVGSYEFKYLALTYNSIYEINEESKKTLRYHAEHDELTGVLNRKAFDGLTRYLAKVQIPMALLIVDVDRFKTVNDNYGHETGDAVLKKVAHLLQSHTRSNDQVIRYGGDEFVVIMTDITADNAYVITEKVTEINEILMAPLDGLPAVSLSAGAAFSEEGYNPEVFKKADEALYQIKMQDAVDVNFHLYLEGNYVLNNE